MLHKINKIKDFGILENFNKDSVIKSFCRFNLIYGWNGSGKTTLVRLFRCLETKMNHFEYPNAEFTIELVDSSKVESKNYKHNLDIRVFNQDFVDENLSLFEAQTKPIIFISKEKIEEKKLLEKQKNELLEVVNAIVKFEKEKDELDKKIDESHKNVGKTIKDFLLGTVYANVTYNKKTASDIWKNIKKQNLLSDRLELSEDDLIINKNYTLINSKKDEIVLSTLPACIDIEKISEIEIEINRLITLNISSLVIDRLKDNPAIGEWVSSGLELHKQYKSESCEFCGGPLKKEKFELLEAHFSKEYKELIDKLTHIVSKLEKGIRAEFINEKHLLYDSLKIEYENSIKETNIKLHLINSKLNEWIRLLSEKKLNPFSKLKEISYDDSTFLDFNFELTKLNEVIVRHNEISVSHKELAEAAKTKIEYHFVNQSSLIESLEEAETKLDATVEKLVKSQEKENIFKKSIKVLEDGLKNDTLAIEGININLHKFLGRNNIILERQEEGGYQLLRDGIRARNLSEGEKTAISLIYFFSKIQENDALIANQIIVLDDPISSFDSNHLFNASSLIKNCTKGVSQLIVLTHNFWFFKQVRDWMNDKNKRSRDGEDKVLANFYVLKSGQLFDASENLTKTHSEYQFVFNSILQYQNTIELSVAQSFSLANSVRRLLEVFSSFKTGSNAGINDVLQLGLKNGINTQQKERIYYFLNKYSHLDRIESFDNTIEPLFEEGINVVEDVLRMIKTIDEDHYLSMVRVCGYEDKIKD